MYISRIYIKNYRNFQEIDIRLNDGVTCIIGENNSGKTNLFEALRLVLDNSLPSTRRQLEDHDIFARADFRSPNQVIVSVEFSDFDDCLNSAAFVCAWRIGDLKVARLTYRFRPRVAIIDQNSDGNELNILKLTEDYEWKLYGGGKIDPKCLEWNMKDGQPVSFSDLQYFRLEFLKDLRDVLQDLRRERFSPLRRIIRLESDSDSEAQLVDILERSNNELDSHPGIQSISERLRVAYSNTVGEAFQDIHLSLGMAEASFDAIVRSLKILFQSSTIQNKKFDISMNGQRLNNILYISMVLQAFDQLITTDNSAGKLLLIEEPEAHLHPHLQRTLFDILSNNSSQVLLTTHSTHISSQAPIESLVSLTSSPNQSGPIATRLVLSSKLEDREIADLERYLDATRSTLLYARKVMLVEGAAEIFLIPEMIKAVKHTNLDRYGISVIPIYGKHFDSYAKLFSKDGLPKKCAIIADGDLKDMIPCDLAEDMCMESNVYPNASTDYVSVFRCQTTFERAITTHEGLEMLIATLRDLNKYDDCRVLEVAKRQLDANSAMSAEEKETILRPLRKNVLKVAKNSRIGKGRFAQVAARHTHLLTKLPDYIERALHWLIQDEAN